jgi:ABC-type transport system involved in cytochrome bd biosynthesis fused ATPase/permease subunit
MGTTIPFKGNDPLDLQFTDKVSYYYVGLALLLLAVAVTAYVARSRLGYYLVAVGQDEDAAEAVGIRSPWVKQQANFISAFFAGLRAVQDLDFDVNEGEILALVGPNGAGKTTTFHLITGFHRPDSGRVLFRGENLPV